jgi:hypothetical protein
MERVKDALGVTEQGKLSELTLAWPDVVVLAYSPLKQTKDAGVN